VEKYFDLRLTGPVKHGVLFKVNCRAQDPSAEMRGGFLRWGSAIERDRCHPRCATAHRGCASRREPGIRGAQVRPVSRGHGHQIVLSGSIHDLDKFCRVGRKKSEAGDLHPALEPSHRRKPQSPHPPPLQAGQDLARRFAA
jgi:hypothetical protein